MFMEGYWASRNNAEAKGSTEVDMEPGTSKEVSGCPGTILMNR